MADVSGETIDMTKGEAPALDPFNEDCQQMSWASEVSIGQLQEEIVEAFGPGVHLATRAPRDTHGAEVAVSAQNPLLVFVHPASTDLTAVRAVLSAHRPDPYSGLSPEDRETVQLMEKVRSDSALTPDEYRRALRVLAMANG